jgi:hypothetical protein
MNEPADRWPSCDVSESDEAVCQAAVSCFARSDEFVAACKCLKPETCFSNIQRYQFCSYRIENSLKYEIANDASEY